MRKELNTKIISEYFEKQKDVSAVYLFGSFVKGSATENSDVDFGILFEYCSPLLHHFERKLEIANDLEDLLKRKIDVVDLDSVDSYFIHQLMLNKEVILDRDVRRRVMFEVEKRRDYFDRKRFYDLYYLQAVKRLAEKGRRRDG